MDSILTKIGQINSSATARYSVVLESVLKTCMQMLKDRGFTILNDCRTIGDITYKMQENEPVFWGEHPTESNVFVFFHNEERIGVKQLRLWNEIRTNSQLIIVSLEGPTAFTKKEADQFYPNVQFFSYQNLCVNITKHSLVPKHECLSKEEKMSCGIDIRKDEDWPKLYTNDAIAQYYNYKPGDLIKITRTIGYPEPVYFYRLVCTPPTA